MKIPLKIKAVIFDMDGLMIDSEPYWRNANEAFFKKYQKPFKNEVNTQIMGMGQREIVEQYKRDFGFSGDTQELIRERKQLLYESLFVNVSLLEGVEEIVHALAGKLQLAIATSGHTQEKTTEILEKVGLQDYFGVLVSGDDVHKSKPAPDIYLKTAELLKISAEHCLVFEDSPNGVQAGKAAGMTVYGINKDEKIYSKLKEAGADAVFHSLREIEV